MRPVRIKKALLTLSFALALVPWALVLGTQPASAAAQGEACVAHSDCDWPMSCVSGKCKSITTFRLVPECASVRSAIPGKAPPVPSLTCLLQTFANIAQLILGITGSAALLMFVYGGFLMVTSAGSQEKVSKGKTVMTNAVIGIMIIMTSGLLIQYGMSKIGISKDYNVVGSSSNCAKGEINVQLPTGVNACVKDCNTSLAPYGFSCMSVKNADNAGRYCVADLCNGNADQVCCYKPQ